MTAAAFGASLLAEIEVERLDKVLLACRQILRQRFPQAKTTGISLLDNHLLDLETERQTPAPAVAQGNDAFPGFPLSSAPEPEPSGESYRSPVVEIIGTHPGSGKTRLLYQIAADALLARRGEGLVVWIDADAHLDYLTLRTILLAKILREGTSTDDADRSVVVHIRRLHIFQPQTSQALQEVMEGLHDYLVSAASSAFDVHSLQAILISGLSAFHWEDRKADLESSPEHLPPGAARSTQRLERWDAVVQALRALQSKYDCVIATTNTALFVSEHAVSGLQVQKRLPAVWDDFVTLRIVVTRDRRPRFEPGTSAVEALKEAEWRSEVMRESSFMAWIESTAGREGRRSESRQMSFRVHEDGVSMPGRQHGALL